jgi:hypothetical protein
MSCYVGRCLAILAGCNIPEVNVLAIAATGNELSIRAKSNRSDTYRTVISTAGNKTFIRAESDTIDSSFMSTKLFQVQTIGGAPQPNRLIFTAAGSGGSICVEGK